MYITIGIYQNKSYKTNIVAPEDLERHIEYNKTMRPGRLLYVDGKRVYNGLVRKDRLAEYDELAEKIFNEMSRFKTATKPMTPYR